MASEPLEYLPQHQSGSSTFLKTSLNQASRQSEFTSTLSQFAVNKEFTVHRQINQRLACASSSSLGSALNHSTLRTFEKSIVEQSHSNDFKALELILIMKNMKQRQI